MIICSLSKRLLSIIAVLPLIYLLDSYFKINDLFGTLFSILNGIDFGTIFQLSGSSSCKSLLMRLFRPWFSHLHIYFWISKKQNFVNNWCLRHISDNYRLHLYVVIVFVNYSPLKWNFDSVYLNRKTTLTSRIISGIPLFCCWFTVYIPTVPFRLTNTVVCS
jgi:hypothetical protein